MTQQQTHISMAKRVVEFLKAHPENRIKLFWEPRFPHKETAAADFAYDFMALSTGILSPEERQEILDAFPEWKLQVTK